MWYFSKRVYIQPENKGYGRHMVVIGCFQLIDYDLYLYFKHISYYE